MSDGAKQKLNNLLAEEEIKKKLLNLQSTPKYVTIGTHFNCNASCTFCLGGDYQSFTLERYKSFFEPALGNVLTQANNIGFCGFGEILLYPRIAELLDYLDITVPNQSKAFTTNGIVLSSNELCEKLTNGKYDLMISLHASNAKLHESLTKTKKFAQIIENIKKLVTLKRQKKAHLSITLVFVITNENLEDLPAFIEMAAALEADCVSANYITMYEPAQIDMSVFWNKQKANEVLLRAEQTAKKYENLRVNLPLAFKEHEKNNDVVTCRDPWEFFYVETQGSVNPCCLAGSHIGYMDKTPFEEIWNSQGYKCLREGLVTGKTHIWCKNCTKFDRNNVNKILSHITFRPETQEKLLKYIFDNKDKYNLAKEDVGVTGFANE
jgi:MoaA/NifB/PqqE/SkfB family radical SAM enzyme